MMKGTPLAFAFAALAMAAPLQAQNHVYLLNGTYADLYAGPSLGNDGGTLSLTGYTFSPNAGLSLSNVFAASTSYSLAIRSYFDGLGGYRKMVDFKDRLSDNGAYALNDAANLYPAATGPSGAYANGVLAMTVWTRDASTNVFSGYVNGVLQYSFVDAAGYGDFTAAGGIARFFEDDFATSQGESGSGFVDYIATYDRALTANEVAGLTVVTGTPEPASLALLATGLVGIVGVRRRVKR